METFTVKIKLESAKYKLLSKELKKRHLSIEELLNNFIGNYLSEITLLKRQYNNEWLLIEVEEFDEDYKPIKGKVIAHSPVEDEILKALAACENENVALEYVGKIPEDVGILL